MRLFVLVLSVFSLSGAALAQPPTDDPPVLLMDSDDDDDMDPFGDPDLYGGSAVELHGFLDLRGGSRLEAVDHAKRTSMQEARLQLKTTGDWEWFAFELVGDAIFDPVLSEHDIDLYTGDGFVDLRKANVTLAPLDFLALKIGRQAMTWGTGDLVFINDLFPKDWTAFLIGRDLEYLKAPSDAIRLSFYSEWLDVDVAYTPRFNADRYPDRRRLTSYDPMYGRTAGYDAVPDEARPDGWFDDDEFAGRISSRVGSYDLALYGYHGFWKSPGGFEMNDPSKPLAGGRVSFPELSALGASVQGPLLGGILSVEGGYYYSADDADGEDLLTNNSQVRGLIGYEREAAKNFTVGVQYYAEWMQDYGAYQRSLEDFENDMGALMGQVPAEQLPSDLPALHEADSIRQVVTTRLRLQLLQQNLLASVFAFYSPSDQDAFVMPSLSYKIGDRWTAAVGANILVGEEDHTFFGQLAENSNVWSSVRMAW